MKRVIETLVLKLDIEHTCGVTDFEKLAPLLTKEAIAQVRGVKGVTSILMARLGKVPATGQ